MTYNNHISELVGNTPILKLNNYEKIIIDFWDSNAICCLR